MRHAGRIVSVVVSGIAKAIPCRLIGDWNLSAAPMFLLMGYIASVTGLTNGLFASTRGEGPALMRAD